MAAEANLIDWTYLLFSTIWIVGFSIILAGLSFHYWLAIEAGEKFWNSLKAKSFQLMLWGGLLAVTIGFAGVSQQGWERIIWIVLAVASLVQLLLEWRSDGMTE